MKAVGESGLGMVPPPIWMWRSPSGAGENMDTQPNAPATAAESRSWRMLVVALQALGFGAALGIIGWVASAGKESGDGLTIGILAAVTVVYALFVGLGWWWQRRLDETPVEPAAHQLLMVEGEERLPVGDAEELVDGAVAIRMAPKWLGVGSNTPISLGLAGTFLGLTVGLFGAVPCMQGDLDWDSVAECEGLRDAVNGELGVAEGDVELLGSADLERREELVQSLAIEQAMAHLLDGAKLAFLKSLLGILLALVWTFRMLDIHRREESLRRTLLADVHRRFPAISLERLSQVNAAEQRAAMEALADAVQRLQGTTTDGQAGTLADVAAATRVVEDAVEGLNNTTQELFEQLPEKLATPIGAQVGSVVAPELGRLNDTMATLSSTGADAFGSVMSEKVGSEMSTLQGALAAVSTALQALPTTLARGSAQAVRTLTTVSDSSAQKLGEAASVVAGQTTAAGSTVARLDAAVDRLVTMLEGVEGEGQRITTAFAGVTEPLTALPPSLDRVRAGIDASGERLRVDVVDQLGALRDGLRAQTDAQRQLSETVVQQREALDHSGATLLRNIQAAERHAGQLTQSVEALRTACESTVAALEAASGSQQEGANRSIEQLLEAVGRFNHALGQSQATLRDASRQAVASTEQVTIAAAREVADAMKNGARAMEESMARAIQTGARLESHGAALEAHVKVAESALGSMESHAKLLGEHSGELQLALQGVAQPLVLARDSLQVVPVAIESATSAMGEERGALVGLGRSLREQAELLREREAALTQRTAELRKLQDVLSHQWTGHMGRLVEGHTKVKEAWQYAMASATEGHERHAQMVAEYARKVEESLGLKQDLQHLDTTLGEVADGLASAGRLGRSIDALVVELRAQRQLSGETGVRR